MKVLDLSNRNIFDYYGARYELIDFDEKGIKLKGVNSHVLDEVLHFTYEQLDGTNIKQIEWKMK